MDDTIRTETLRCELSDPEVAERATSLATLTGDLTAAEAAKAAAAKHHGARVQEIRDELNAVSKIVRERAEYREVEVRDVPDFDHGAMETFRSDTGARIRVRPLTAEERQMRLVEEQRREAIEGDVEEDRIARAREDREREDARE